MIKKFLFLILVGALLLVALLTQYTLNMDQLLSNSLSDQMTQEQIQSMFDFKQQWQWVGYAILPLIMALKIAVISAVLYMGMFFFEIKITYKKLFGIVTQAEFVFVAVALVKLIWFMVQSEYILEDVQRFYPLSALGIVGHQGISPWFIYPFQTLNLFEVVYWIVLAWLIGKEIQSTTDKALKIVASSYGSALLIWVVAVMFFTLNVS